VKHTVWLLAWCAGCAVAPVDERELERATQALDDVVDGDAPEVGVDPDDGSVKMEPQPMPWRDDHTVREGMNGEEEVLVAPRLDVDAIADPRFDTEATAAEGFGRDPLVDEGFDAGDVAARGFEVETQTRREDALRELDGPFLEPIDEHDLHAITGGEPQPQPWRD
jgi:hypothetical protein